MQLNDLLLPTKYSPLQALISRGVYVEMTSSNGAHRWAKKVKDPTKTLEVRLASPKDESGGPDWPLGWYIFVRRHAAHFRAILVRFHRQKDAEIACHSLLQAGLITLKRLRSESPVNVLRILCQDLQW